MSKTSAELITQFAEAVRAHEMKGSRPPEEWDDLEVQYRRARSELAARIWRMEQRLERLPETCDGKEHEDVFLGDTIREHRERLLISKAELARRVGVSDVSVSYWESGEIKEIGHNNLIRLARALGLTVSELVGGP